MGGKREGGGERGGRGRSGRGASGVLKGERKIDVIPMGKLINNWHL